MIDKIEENPLEKYVKYSVDELETLKESYIEKINECIDNHWLSRFPVEKQDKYYKIFFIISCVLLGVGLLIMLIFFGIAWMKTEKIIDYLTLFTIAISLVMAGGGLLRLLVDGSRTHIIELKSINLILKKKKLNKNKQIMLDSNILDDIINGTISRDEFTMAKKKNYKFFITHVQVDELNDCPDQEKRKKLNLFLTTISPEMISTESVVVGVSRVGFAKLGDGDKYDKLKNNSSNIKKSKDALIGETALKNKLVLLSNDKQFRNKIRSEGGNAISVDDFKKIIEQ